MREYKSVANVLQIATPEDPMSFVVHEGLANDISQGKLNLFEGGIKDGEDRLDAAKRIFLAKSGLELDDANFEWLDFVVAESEVAGQGILLEAEVFMVKPPPGFPVKALRNSLVQSSRDIAKARVINRMTNVSAAALSKIYGL